jgi:hypothetical protein
MHAELSEFRGNMRVNSLGARVIFLDECYVSMG